MSDCVICKTHLPHNASKECINGSIYCGDCAFKNELITEEKYIKNHLYWLMVDGIRAKVHDGKIYISAFNRRFEFELNNKDHRKSKEYKDWRKQVFDRDLYTCKKCGQIGGNLNAHHIKEFAKYPKLRYEVNNGITLCESCHKKIHKKKG